MAALVAKHPALTTTELALVESHLPRCIALRRIVPRAGGSVHTIWPVHAAKNALAWLYNILKGGVDRLSQHVVRLLGCLQFWALSFTWQSKTALRRCIMLAVAALQAVRVRRAAQSFLHGGASFSTFRSNVSRFGDIIDEFVDLGVAMADTSRYVPVMGGAFAPAAADAVLPHDEGSMESRRAEALLHLRRSVDASHASWERTPAATQSASTSGPGTGSTRRSARLLASSGAATGTDLVGSQRRLDALRSAATDATPLSKARLELAALVEEGYLRPGLRADAPELRSLSAGEAQTLARTVGHLRSRQRAPPLSEFDTEADFRAVRLSKTLCHDLVPLSAAEGGVKDVRCVLCTSTGGQGGRARAEGRCKVCRVALCRSCLTSFHTVAHVADE